MSGTSPDFTDGRLPAFLIFFTPVLVGIVTLLISKEPVLAIFLATWSAPTVFILLVLFVLRRMIYRFVKRFLGSIESPNPVVIKIEQYEEAMAVCSEVQIAAERRCLEAQQRAQRKELEVRRAAERARIKAVRERLEAQRAAERSRWEEERARQEAERARQAAERAERRKRREHWESLRGIQFEQELAALYRHLGYQVQSTSKSGDQGIDLILTKDGKISIVQCKGQKRPASPAVVRELFGSFHAFEGASHAILACTGGFTQGAKDFARGKLITLISAREMAEMAGSVTQSQQQLAPKNSDPSSVPVAPSSRMRQQHQLIRVDAASCEPTGPHCDNCGSKLVLYKGSIGMFWGCSGYPECTFRRS